MSSSLVGFPFTENMSETSNKSGKKRLPVSFLNILEYFKLLTQYFFSVNRSPGKIFKPDPNKNRSLRAAAKQANSAEIYQQVSSWQWSFQKWSILTKNFLRYSLHMVIFNSFFHNFQLQVLLVENDMQPYSDSGYVFVEVTHSTALTMMSTFLSALLSNRKTERIRVPRRCQKNDTERTAYMSRNVVRKKNYCSLDFWSPSHYDSTVRNIVHCTIKLIRQ